MADPFKPRAPFAPWDRRQLPGLFDVEETARRVGNYKWAEMKLFEALGERIRDVEQGPDGYLYLLTDGGKLIQVRD